MQRAGRAERPRDSCGPQTEHGQPRAPALAMDRNPERGFHRQAQGGSEVGAIPASGEGCAASQHGLGRFWKVTQSTALASMSL